MPKAALESQSSTANPPDTFYDDRGIEVTNMELTALLSSRTLFGLLIVAFSLLHGVASFKPMAAVIITSRGPTHRPHPQSPCHARPPSNLAPPKPC